MIEMENMVLLPKLQLKHDKDHKGSFTRLYSSIH